ncbi:MAG TPA: FtsX-like permease family protein, partial [Gemmatimonadales bacterium]|nr:FtsX-like permease family protein [Gemmatimonadales bacterium]
QRRHEMGVRCALGAEWGDLVHLVVGEGVLLVAFGIGLGLVVAMAAAPAIGPLLYQTSPRDPSVMAVVATVLLVTAALACLVPALRASRVDPIVALRAE